jgi:Epoxide hydrolase N terminus
MASERHVLRVPDGDLEELGSRLRGARWPVAWPGQDAGTGWQAGTDEGELRRLAGYWADGYNWRSQEAEVNALPGWVTTLDGTDVFYLRFEAEVSGALPLVLTHPEAVVGIHLLAVAGSPSYDPATVTPGERRYIDEVAAWFTDAGGYGHEQMTRPRTLAYGLSDSPAGLLAWLVEKYREWSDCDGDLSRRFSDRAGAATWAAGLIRPLWRSRSSLQPGAC